MRSIAMAAVLLAGVTFPVAARAAAPPDNVLFAGFFTPRVVNPGTGTWCMIDGTNSTFVQSQSRKKTLISFPDIFYAPNGSLGPTAYRLDGHARLNFTPGSTTAGTVYFNARQTYPAAIYQPAFKNFTQSYDATAHTLTVRFNIVFQGCTLPILAVYRN